jgi:hypothetical protein
MNYPIGYQLPVTGYRVNYPDVYLVIILGATHSSPGNSSAHLGCYRFTQDVTGSPGRLQVHPRRYRSIVRDATSSLSGMLQVRQPANFLGVSRSTIGLVYWHWYDQIGGWS